MNTSLVLILVSLILIGLVAGVFVFKMLFVSSGNDKINILTNSAKGNLEPRENSRRSKVELNLASNPPASKKQKDLKDESVILFQAGIFSDLERQAFNKRCLVAFAVFIPVCVVAGLWLSGFMGAIFGAVTGFMFGRIYPDRVKSKRIKLRQEDASYYLPLVIEQLSIGVSSGLDIGPCVQYIVEMANERKANNVVTELLAHVLKLSKAGMSLEEALSEVGTISGFTPIRNTFMFLSQCARHGGEISKQLMDLSQAVGDERQSIVEAKINSLPNKATGALGMIFIGFFIMLFTGLFVKILDAMK